MPFEAVKDPHVDRPRAYVDGFKPPNLRGQIGSRCLSTLDGVSVPKTWFKQHPFGGVGIYVLPFLLVPSFLVPQEKRFVFELVQKIQTFSGSQALGASIAWNSPEPNCQWVKTKGSLLLGMSTTLS